MNYFTLFVIITLININTISAQTKKDETINYSKIDLNSDSEILNENFLRWISPKIEKMMEKQNSISSDVMKFIIDESLEHLNKTEFMILILLKFIH